MNSSSILVEKTSETIFFTVPSSDGSKVYDTWYDKDHKWICDCPDYYYRKRFCKQMRMCAELEQIDDHQIYHEVKDGSN